MRLPIRTTRATASSEHLWCRVSGFDIEHVAIAYQNISGHCEFSEASLEWSLCGLDDETDTISTQRQCCSGSHSPAACIHDILLARSLLQPGLGFCDRCLCTQHRTPALHMTRTYILSLDMTRGWAMFHSAVDMPCSHQTICAGIRDAAGGWFSPLQTGSACKTHQQTWTKRFKGHTVAGCDKSCSQMQSNASGTPDWTVACSDARENDNFNRLG